MSAPHQTSRVKMIPQGEGMGRLSLVTLLAVLFSIFMETEAIIKGIMTMTSDLAPDKPVRKEELGGGWLVERQWWEEQGRVEGWVWAGTLERGRCFRESRKDIRSLSAAEFLEFLVSIEATSTSDRTRVLTYAPNSRMESGILNEATELFILSQMRQT
ncbi:hypothetical protein CCH79_00007420 [Gambusia affinis]|uniref:Uncharacterized protein n=1 Tax=Gambusia affinis TaxID=33528 RepID=A0A315WD09_GAMAF|nr:hypothetical protein CCH79_00007420 [Gambusia affinis]